MFVKRKNDRRAAISPLFLLVTVLLPVLSGKSWVLLFAMAALLHECGHFVTLWLLGGRVERFSLRLSGAEIGYRSNCLSYGREILLALAGPGTNLVCACLCAVLVRLWPEPGLYRFIGCHLTLALFNLLPALPLDGGRALKVFLESRWPLFGEYITRIISGGVGLVLALLGLSVLKTNRNPTLLAAGMVILLKSDVKTLYTSPKNC